MADKEEKAIVPVNDLVIDDELCNGETHVGAYVTIKGSDEKKSSNLVFEDFTTFIAGKSAIYLDQPVTVSKNDIKEFITAGGAKSPEILDDSPLKKLDVSGVDTENAPDITFGLDALFLKKAELDKERQSKKNGALLLSFSVQAEGDGIVKQLTGIELPLEVTAIGLRVVRCPDEKGTKERLKRYVDSLRS